jgi:aminopeptidase N
VLPAGGGIGYGNFTPDRGTTVYLYLKGHLPEIRDPLTRGVAWVTLWEAVLDGQPSAARFVRLAIEALPRESDEQNVQRILSYTRQAYWKFLKPAERAQLAAPLEQVLKDGLFGARTSSLKSAWFSALRDVAVTEPTVAWLEQVWRKTETVPGLTLAEPDYITLALELAVRQRPAWKEILDEEYSRIENPDRKERFAYVRPALSADQAVRDSFFARLENVASRQREPWVLEGLTYLHHPLREASSEKYVPKSLAMLREIQATGDIFFPKRWMDATLGGHGSASVARMVSRFLAELPADYPDRLRRVILSSSDDVFRASGVERVAP